MFFNRLNGLSKIREAKCQLRQVNARLQMKLFAAGLVFLMVLVCGCYEVFDGEDAARVSKVDYSPWSVEKAWDWYEKQDWLVGFNYVPSSACNTTEWWQGETFDPETIDREMGWAEDLGYNTCRAFIQYIVWKDDPKGFKKRFDRFLEIADRHGISVMPVLFDDCAFGDPVQPDPYLGKQREPVPGMILPSWTPSPGKKLGNDPEERESLEKYVKDVISTFRKDKRIIVWDLFNEPMNRAKVGTVGFIDDIFKWARQARPKQPLTVGAWGPSGHAALKNSDVVSFHCYGDFSRQKTVIASYLSYGRPTLCTEWMARVFGSNFATDLPLFKSNYVGCYQWGLVNGRTQCQYPWSNKRGGKVNPETGWFHDILHRDGSAYRPEEISAIRRIAADKKFDIKGMRNLPGHKTREEVQN